MKNFMILSILFFSGYSYSLTANLKVSGRIMPDMYKVVNEENVLSVEKKDILSSKIEKDVLKLENKESFNKKDWGSIKVERMKNIEVERYLTIVSFGI